MNPSIQNTLNSAVNHWPYVQKIVQVPHSKREYQNLIQILDGLLELGGRDENHPLASLVTLISQNIENYEQNLAAKFESKLSAIDYLKLLIKTHELHQDDLPEIGAQSVVSAVIAGKRKLNARQINALSKRFKVNPNVFLS